MIADQIFVPFGNWTLRLIGCVILLISTCLASAEILSKPEVERFLAMHPYARLRFLAPTQALDLGTCSGLAAIELINEHGKALTFEGEMKVSVSDHEPIGGLNFFSDSQCSSPISSLLITGGSGGHLYVEPTTLESLNSFTIHMSLMGLLVRNQTVRLIPPATNGGKCTTKIGAWADEPNNGNASDQAEFSTGWNSLVNALGYAPTMLMTGGIGYANVPLSQWFGVTGWDIGSWQASANPTLGTDITPIIWIPMALQGDDADTDFKAISSGAWDSDITGILQAWVTAGHTTLYIRPGHEMNGSWYPWAVTTANATDYVAAFQHIATLAHKFSAAKVTVVFNPNVGDNGVPMTSYYPGDAYVEDIGLDEYGEPWTSDNAPMALSTGPSDVTLSMLIDFAAAHGKPFALPEVGGNDATYPTNLGLAASQEITKVHATVDYIGLWDNSSDNTTFWSDNPTTTGAWNTAISEISKASVANVNSNPNCAEQ